MNVNRDSIQRVTEADYADMVRQLGIATPRPGRDPNNPDPSRQPNYDELKANPFVHYPEALITFQGKKVTNARMWNKTRRPELVKYFEDEVYGRIPDNVPAVNWKTVSEEKVDMNGIPCINRVLRGVVDNSSYPSITVEIQASILYPEEPGKCQ